ncbi:Motile sperm domain-containing protein 1 [Halocaridina rubra]|uniref:Motile sperm domain-containing protein 1 n=1 Tax=Halocaridina rubra TaxID=373956 RepID=A0AAN8WMY0_HALRR
MWRFCRHHPRHSNDVILTSCSPKQLLCPIVSPVSGSISRGNVVMQGSGLDGRIPIFVFPPSLTFYLDDPSTHKQILTLYNPYDFYLAYQILCNRPGRYVVDESNGVIRPKCYLDIVVSHTEPSLNNVNSQDKIRFQIYEEGRRPIGREPLGKRDIPVTLVKGVPDSRSSSTSDGDRFESIQASGHAAAGSGIYSTDGQLSNVHHQREFGASRDKSPSMVLVCAAVVCIIGLLLPTEGESHQSLIPQYLHLSSNFKIVIAFSLGMLTLSVLRAG